MFQLILSGTLMASISLSELFLLNLKLSIMMLKLENQFDPSFLTMITIIILNLMDVSWISKMKTYFALDFKTNYEFLTWELTMILSRRFRILATLKFLDASLTHQEITWSHQIQQGKYIFGIHSLMINWNSLFLINIQV